MDNATVRPKKAGHKNENPLQVSSNKGSESSKTDCSNDRSVVKPEDVLLSNIDKSKISHFCIQKLFLRHVSGLNKKIPKKITSLEEKYVGHCLELIDIRASRSNFKTFPAKINFLAERFGSRIISSRSGCEALFLISTGSQNLALSSSGCPVFGSVTKRTSTVNDSNTPSIRQIGASNNDDRKTITLEVREPANSSGVSSSGSSMELRNERLVLEDQRFGPKRLHKRLVSSSSSSAYSRGMLKCSWHDGSPHYMFSTEDQRDVYTTNLLKADQGSDYLYAFRHKDSYLVAKMSVCTSFALCAHGAETMETQFVLRAMDHSVEGDVKQKLGMSKGLSKMMMNVLRQRTCSKLDGSFAVQESPSGDGGVFSESPRLEFCAIVVKDRVFEGRNEAEIGGWGLKFLRKGWCSTSRENTGCCSAGIDVLVPAGFHGEPRTRSGGPSSIVERWRSGGSCDCGGWDVGCPLSVLKPISNKNSSFDLFVQGCKQSASVLKMVKIHDGLYDIQYESTLSTLQSFSIAVAKIHSQSPIFRPKSYRK